MVSHDGGTGAAYEGSYNVKRRTLTFHQEITIKKRIFQPEEWPNYKLAVESQRYMMQEPVIFTR